jgi:hypothetical protein
MSGSGAPLLVNKTGQYIQAFAAACAWPRPRKHAAPRRDPRPTPAGPIRNGQYVSSISQPRCGAHGKCALRRTRCGARREGRAGLGDLASGAAHQLSPMHRWPRCRGVGEGGAVSAVRDWHWCWALVR